MLWGIALVSALQAYPPVPHFVVEGTLRDELGRPLHGDGVEVRLLAENGVVYRSSPNPFAGKNTNYQIVIPMDAGHSGAPYHRLAQWPDFNYRIEVMVKGVRHVPIEMVHATSESGQSGQIRLLNLTLGEDVDGDGLPDLWESAVSAGGIEKVLPEDDSDGDGITNLDEYLAGTLAFDADHGFRMKFKEFNEEQMVFEFIAVRGRIYWLLESTDLEHWSDAPFQIQGNDTFLTSYLAASSGPVQIVLPNSVTDAVQATYKLVVK